MDKYLTLPIRVEEFENDAIVTRGVQLCMGIVKENGSVIIPEQARNYKNRFEELEKKWEVLK